ncbi:hypothetical protein CJ030_MR2G020041 [Morella rubra]|uniref:Uncharacterized protein n=1 Tax=Morella rubra TaxID=262757 RepID=A0A6A1WJE3_9ROSI|nr:hypothetical protein CJ030_MR2G020041 [Morella rubra]
MGDGSPQWLSCLSGTFLALAALSEDVPTSAIVRRQESKQEKESKHIGSNVYKRIDICPGEGGAMPELEKMGEANPAVARETGKLVVIELVNLCLFLPFLTPLLVHPDLVVSPLKVAKFLDLLIIHRNPDVLFLRGIRTMFIEDNYYKGLKLEEKAMEARNPKGTYLFCMLELLNGPHLKSDDVDRVFRFLGPLKDNEDMMWVRMTTIQQLIKDARNTGFSWCL